MANGKIRFGKQLGGQLAFVIPDGVTNTEVIGGGWICSIRRS